MMLVGYQFPSDRFGAEKNIFSLPGYEPQL
jgi:hypothetical protein